jgi:hypothetical protein
MSKDPFKKFVDTKIDYVPWKDSTISLVSASTVAVIKDHLTLGAKNPVPFDHCRF